ncbi:uncharacterized protein J4E84_001500 [Alternaria hordeiaustralica]|uniref:uncharacterized protein n=1 Tax=Alternaria hordeiaustralica TaxID=1187925 RepID=UPI0020C34973|nr:uncharacterized protein J4E84_001500 [Alternaria hordeiaustralica]KAI4694877.1 hypothetical protein J4E84_001500 [Alternaria hordeiaustralica]
MLQHVGESSVFHRISNARTWKAIRNYLHKQAPSVKRAIRRFEQEGISFLSLDPDVMDYIAAYSDEILRQAPSLHSPTETGTTSAVDHDNARGSAIPTRATGSKKRAASDGTVTGRPSKTAKTTGNHERGPSAAVHMDIEGREEEGLATGQDDQEHAGLDIVGAATSENPTNLARGSSGRAEMQLERHQMLGTRAGKGKARQAMLGRMKLTSASRTVIPTKSPRRNVPDAPRRATTESATLSHDKFDDAAVISYLQKRYDHVVNIEREASSELRKVQADNTNLRQEIEELRQQVKELQTPSNAELRQHATTLKQQGETRSLNEKTTLSIQALELRQCKERNQLLEERLKNKEALVGHQKCMLDNLREPHLIPRSQAYPVVYDIQCLGPMWSRRMEGLARVFPQYNPATTLSPQYVLPAKFEIAMRTITGLPLAQTGNLALAACFANVTALPTDVNIYAALFKSYALRWVYDTNFHTDGLDSEKLEDLWQSIALEGGLKSVRKQDTIATLFKINNRHFRDNELPAKAKHQIDIFIEEFRELIPWLNTKRTELTTWLKYAMIIKIELLVSNQHHKMAFPPPGVPFDKETMHGFLENGDSPGLGEDWSKYRVKVCLSPALYKCISEPEWSDINGFDPSTDNYKDALLEARDFFPEEPGKYHGWEGSFLVARALVSIEKHPEVPQSSQVPRLRLIQRSAEKSQDVAEDHDDEANSEDGDHDGGSDNSTDGKSNEGSEDTEDGVAEQ